jgi:hypothetical protein
MFEKHEAVGTLIHVDGLLEDPAWANGSESEIRELFDIIKDLDGSLDAAPTTDAPASSSSSRQAPTVPDLRWTVSAWPSPTGPWFVVHHRPSTYTVRTQSLDRLEKKLLTRFQM